MLFCNAPEPRKTWQAVTLLAVACSRLRRPYSTAPLHWDSKPLVLGISGRRVFNSVTSTTVLKALQLDLSAVVVQRLSVSWTVPCFLLASSSSRL